MMKDTPNSTNMAYFDCMNWGFLVPNIRDLANLVLDSSLLALGTHSYLQCLSFSTKLVTLGPR